MPATAQDRVGMTWLLADCRKRKYTFSLAGLWKSCNFAGRNKSGIRYDFPKVRAVAYRFSTTYLLHSAANIIGWEMATANPLITPIESTLYKRLLQAMTTLLQSAFFMFE